MFRLAGELEPGASLI